ncbi:MAG: BatA domain-containing protein [Chitinophagaceae bacterium]
MFQLFNPIALLAAAAVIIPVLIHLWNKRKGKTLKVGSISLLKENNKTSSRNIKITDWPLLLLRCLLLLLIATLLAKPFWQNKPGKNKGGWIVVRDHELSIAYQQQRPLIDSLVQRGFEIHALSPQSDLLSLDDTSLYQSTVRPELNYWSYIHHLDGTLPDAFPVYMIADLSADHFTGKRPSTNLNLQLVSIDQLKKTDTTEAGAYIDTDGQFISMNKISTNSGNYYESAAALPTSVTDTNSTINIGIYAGSNTADATYLRAALEAISSYTGRPIAINGPEAPNSRQLIFWLQDTEPGDKILYSLVNGGTLFRYANTDSSLVKISSPANTGSSILDGNDADHFYQYASNPSKGTSLWKLANGAPILSTTSNAGKKIIYFNSRLNPQWTDMVWTESLARLLLPIVLPAPDNTGTDLRLISAEQATPHRIQGKQNGRSDEAGFLHRTDLSFALWITTFLVFALERVIAHRQPKEKNA